MKLFMRLINVVGALVTTLNWNMMKRSLHFISTKVRGLPSYNGLSEVDTLFNKFEREMLEKQRFPALD